MKGVKIKELFRWRCILLLSLVVGVGPQFKSIYAQNNTLREQIISSPQAQLIADPGFEAGRPWSAWTIQTSTVFGSPICTTVSGPDFCSSSNGTTGPFAGTGWVFFGFAFGSVEDSTVGQTVTIPTGVTASLTYQMRFSVVQTPFTDTMSVTVDNIVQQTYTEPSTAEGAYTLRTVNLTPFANGGAHTIRFVYHSVDGFTALLLDDINLTTASANVQVSGRVLANTRGVRNAIVTLTDQANHSRTTMTDPFGRFSFDTVAAGQSYTISAAARRFSFTPMTVQVNDNISGLNLTAN